MANTSGSSQYDKITDPPKNVKEAIDWLLRIGELDTSPPKAGQPKNARDIDKAIQKLTGSTRSFQNDIKDLIKKLASFLGYSRGTINGGGIIKNNGTGYQSAYSTAATWPTCRQGSKCSCCQGNGCNCTASSKPGASSCDGTCCNTCDIRICAGIFVALVPALETALRELRDKCNESNNRQQNITSEGLKGYFTALGYEEGYLNNALKGSHVNSKLMSAISKLSTIKSRISDAFKNTGRSTQNGFTATTTAVAPSSASITTPKTVREMLLWLMGLPYCEGYKKFVEKLKENKDVLGSTRPSTNKDDNPLAKQLSAVIFQLPTVFYSVEGNISYLNEVFEQFKKDAPKPRFCYPSDGDQFLKTLSAYVAVCYPILKYLMQRCDKVNSGRGKRAIGGTTSTPAEEQDGSWGDLLVSGEKNNDAQKEPKVASTAAPSSAPKTALRDYLVFMGFKTPTGTVTGDNLYEKALKECFSESMKDDEDEDKAVAGTLTLSRIGGRTSSKNYQKLPALRKLAKHVLQDLYKASNGGGGGSSSNGTTPTTIRQMMLWLIGLPLTTAYKSSGTSPPGPAAGTGALFGEKGPVVAGINQNQALMKLEQPSVTRGRTVSAATGKHFKQQLKDSIVGMIMLFQRIEGGLGSVLEFLKGGFKDTNGGGSSGAAQGNGKFKYEGFSGDESLLNVFSSYVYKVHTQLRFLKVMCKTEKANGGWKECYYTDTSGSGVGDKITCGCSYSDPCCALPLKHFLTNNGNNNGGSGANGNKFKLCDGSNEKYAMGFDAKHLTKNGSKTGYNIYTYLEQLLDPIPTTATQPSSQSTPSSKPLSLLTQYCVAIGNMDPVSLGDHFDVFRELAGDGMWDKIKGEIEKDIKGITTTDAKGETASGHLKTALQAVWPGTHTPPKDHTGDLASLTGCSDSNNCTPFIATLSHGLYNFFDLKQSSLANKINWIYMKMSSLYGKLTKLKDEMTEKCKCCPESNPKPSKPCPGITQCPNCLPLMYKMGLVFGDPVTIGPKNCRELHTKMTAVLDATSTLCLLFTKIEDGRFKPYLLFSAMVVKERKGELKNLQVNGDENINCYTKALGGEYQKHLEAKKEADKKTAKTNKSTRDNALKCNCGAHTYTDPQAVPGTATTVTLTLYFKHDRITEVVFQVPHHGPAYNPLVRLYPRNLKSIVDWLLRIGQTRLGQDTSVASTKESGVTELCKTFWPRIKECLKEQDQEHFKQLVEKVMSLMGLKTQGKKEVEKEVTQKLAEVREKLTKKLNGSGEGFDKTFNKILKFNPKDYIDEVFKDFGNQVKSINSKDRSFECIAKSVSTCMSTALETIKNLAQENKTTIDTYQMKPEAESLNGTDITPVTQLTSISSLKKLCDGFKSFHTAYDKVTKAFNNHLNTAQNNGGNAHWEKINKCVDAFNELGGCAELIGELNSMSGAENMTTASEKLGELSNKLDKVIKQLNGEEIKTLSAQVDEFIDALDDVLKKEGEKALESVLQINGSGTTFDQLLQSYVSNVIQKMKNNTNNTVYDIHLRVRNDLQQLSECLKVMCEVCGTGMKDFANTLKGCVTEGKDHLEQINTTRTTLTGLKDKYQEFNGKSDQKEMTDNVKSAISTIHSLLSNHYIYQTQPIVSNFIDDNAVQAMTTYLKSLPDLIRDRYVLQKWQDDSAYFCGVQEIKEGIVKQSDIGGITGVLKELLKDTFHDDSQFPVTIHNFQVRALIYNFCHKEGIKGIAEGVDVMDSVTKKMNDGNVDWSSITSKKQQLLSHLTSLSTNSYLKHFVRHLRDSTSYYYLCNYWSTHTYPLSPNLANAVMTHNCIRATQYGCHKRDNIAAELKLQSIQSTHLQYIRDD